MNLSVIIPTYNEEKFIRKTVMQIHENLPKAEIIVVSDGSTDNTTGIVKNLQKKVKNLKLIEFKRNRGRDASIIHGFKIAKGDIIGFRR
jgi:glycosyltransferase involved in cell wall biosynthesis